MPLINLTNFREKKRLLAGIFVGLALLFSIGIFLFSPEKGSKIPPADEDRGFSVEKIVYSKDKQGFLVRLKTADSPEIQKNIKEWFSKKGLNPPASEVIILSVEDQRLLEKIAASLPFVSPDFEISYSPRVNTFLIALSPPFDKNRQKALSWLKERGLTDFNKVNVNIGERLPHGSVGIPAPF
ncbi:hypothetical protein HY439_02840 [Candidatus Microgenomates bacterium]|nr:hypothetical protein [Candidatus Microgenomates bacterium]